MREQTALIKSFDSEVVVEPRQRKKREGEMESIVLDSFKMPDRNWTNIIDDFNKSNKRKFPFSALECKVIIEHVKRGLPPQFVFQGIGISNQRHGNLVNKAQELETKFEDLAVKDSLSDDEYDEFNTLIRHPLRILMQDIDRAKGIADLFDWEVFNEMARTQPDVLQTKMKAKFKDIFSDKDNANANVNVQINVGDWIKDI